MYQQQPAFPYQEYTHQLPIECHKGLTSVLHLGKAQFSLGGWSRGGNPPLDHAVIDLTGGEDKRVLSGFKAGNEAAKRAFSDIIAVADSGPWLCAPIKDFGIPDWDRDTFVKLCNAIRALMAKGINVDMLCVGGHGRTGMVGALVVYKLAADKSIFKNDPITWLRGIYCENVVETKQQVDYVWDILGLTGAKPGISGKYAVTIPSKVKRFNNHTKSKTPSDKECYICARVAEKLQTLHTRAVCSLCASPTQPSPSCYVCDVVAPTRACYPDWFNAADKQLFKLEDACYLCARCITNDTRADFISECDQCHARMRLGELDINANSHEIKITCDECAAPKIKKHCFLCGGILLANYSPSEVSDTNGSKREVHITCKYVLSTQITCLCCNKMLEHPNSIITPAWWTVDEKASFITHAVPLCEKCANRAVLED